MLNLLMIFFCVMGFIFCIKFIIDCIFRQRQQKKYYIVFPVSENTEDLEFTMRSFIQNLKWNNEATPCKIYCLDLGMDENTRLVCQKLTEDFSIIEIVTEDNLSRRIESSYFSKTEN
ncbi:MAG: hypothetical protein Q4D44_01130 [Eubacteriales bacterium]|nr:hypothetical protein [Eubacteriales bacterium]